MILKNTNMQKYNLSRYGFSVVLPDSWKIEQDKNTFTCYNPIEGVGALQISVYYNEPDKKVFHKKELVDYLTEKGIIDDDVIKSIETILSMSSVSYIVNDEYWEIAIMTKKEKIFFITYNCEVQDQLEETKDRKRIIKSIK